MKPPEPRKRIRWLIALSLLVIAISAGYVMPAQANQADDCPGLQGYCGDGYCDSYAGETRSNCPEDCGSSSSDDGYQPPNADIEFWADPVTILRGECSYLKWITADVREGNISGDVLERYLVPVPNGELRVCPLNSTTYIFTGLTDRGDQRAFAPVEVIDNYLTLTRTATPTPAATKTPLPTPRTGAGVVVVVTATPEATETETGTPTETAEPRATYTPSPTPTPGEGEQAACSLVPFESRLFTWRTAYQAQSSEEYPIPEQADDEEVHICELPPTGRLCFPIYDGLLEATGGTLDEVKLIECDSEGFCTVHDWPAEASQNTICFSIDPLSGLSCADGCAMIYVPEEGVITRLFKSPGSWIPLIILGALFLLALAILIIIFIIRRRKKEEDSEEEYDYI